MTSVAFAVIASLALASAEPLRQEQAVIDGPDYWGELSVRQVEGKENIWIRNDTQMWASATILNLDADCAVLQPHVRDVFGRDIDPQLISPQAGLSRAWSSNDKEYDQPRGRNARIEIITGGGFGAEDLRDADECGLARRLFWRGFIDQVIIPLACSASGMNLTDKLKYQLLLNALSEVLAQNHQLYEDIMAAPDAVGKLDVARNWLWRDIDSGGPVVNAFYNVLKSSLKDKIAEEARRQALRTGAGFVPVLGPAIRVVDLAMKVWNWGPTVMGVMNYFYDLPTVPAKIVVCVYFRPGVGSIEPLVVRTDSGDKTFTLHGIRLNDPRTPPEIAFYDRRGNLFFTRPPFEVDSRGISMKVRLPGTTLAALEGFLTCRVTFGGRTIALPDRIQLINRLQITRLDPPRGRPGEQVRIYGDDLSPFTITNRAYFRPRGGERKRAQVLVAGRNYLTVVVPDIDEQPDAIEVTVEESYGQRRLESDALPFKRLPGTAEEARRERAAISMPEFETVIEGVLTPGQPRSEHPISVPPGMDVEIELETLSGPAGRPDVFSLARWGIGRRSDGNFYAVEFKEGPMRHRQPASRLRAGTHGTHGAHSFLVVFERGSGDEVRYRAKAKRLRRDDLGTGLDAPETEFGAIVLPVGGPHTAHLCGDPRLNHEDREDWYLIPSVPDQERVRVSITDITKLSNAEARISATLYRMRGIDRENAAVTPGAVSSRDLPLSLEHVEAGERGYLLNVRHEAGLVRYTLRLSVQHVPGPDLALTPIRSSFDQGTKDGWLATGEFSRAPFEPEYSHDNRGNGWIAVADPAVIAGPLDIVLCVDTSGSMGPAIGSVKQSARQLVEELTRRSPSLRLGVIGYKDVDGDGANARTARALSARVRERVEELGSWAAGGGGATKPEDLLFALEGAIEMDWRGQDERGVDVARVVIVITDASAKTDPRRTIASISASARSKAVRVYVLPLDPKDAELAQHARELARGTRGAVLSARSAEETASAVLGAVEQAVDRGSPRYFLAPSKFLGDVSRFERRTLGFSVRSLSGPVRFQGPDVVLKGARKTLELMGGLRPYSETEKYASPFQRMVVPLSEVGLWTVKETGRRATKDDLLEVLSALGELRIRGEYYAGRDDTALDEVVLGGQETVTDAGMDDVTAEWVDLLQRREAQMERFEQSYGSAWGAPWVEPVRQAMARVGMREGIINASSLAVGVRMLLTDGRPSAISRVFDAERERVNRNQEFLRRAGRITGEQAAALRDGLRAWDEQFRRLEGLLADAVNQGVVEAHANELMFRGDPANVMRQQERADAARAAKARISSEIGSMSATGLVPLLR